MEQTLKTNPVEDGSNHLAHYGVLGMKWGVWNEETRARHEGRGGLNRHSTEGKALEIAENLRGKQTDLVNASKPYAEEYRKNEDKWIRATTDYRNTKYDMGMTEEEKKEYDKFLKYEDGNQGSDNSFSMYLHLTGKEDAFNKHVVPMYDDLHTEMWKRLEEASTDDNWSDMRRKVNSELEGGLSESDAKALDLTWLHASYSVPSDKIDPGIVKRAGLRHSSFFDETDYLAHYGVKGMKWGVWNEETQRKYSGGLGRASNAMKAKLSKAGSSASGGARAVAAFSKRKLSAMGAKVNAMASNSKAKREYQKAQKHEIAEQRKELGMSRAKFDKLREKTLKSHDPRTVERGMHTLTDDELNMKINRLQREEMISKIATSKKTREANERKAKSEAFNNNLLVKLGTEYGKKYLDRQIANLSNEKEMRKALRDGLEAVEKSTEERVRKEFADQFKSGKPSPASTASRKASTYSSSGDGDRVRKAVKESVWNSKPVSNSSTVAAGERYITDGTVKAEIIDVRPVDASSARFQPNALARRR